MSEFLDAIGRAMSELWDALGITGVIAMGIGLLVSWAGRHAMGDTTSTQSSVDTEEFLPKGKE
ncbi:hypothetical protein [Saccharopolyspora sp. ASAGF58]|uniref:hypothetical protein n=1 Tax=Saccharopolyspora sp. ASAGF58 TaxID=2719023 RepID=UPI00143FB8E0|nr:hypothetical protein [Saccharopolyspora sp. ASAGF58]QIZ37219.1 hypothetical protein FDZ84_24575 [Saccharopolyspora sp. ASAGF58]